MHGNLCSGQVAELGQHSSFEQSASGNEHTKDSRVQQRGACCVGLFLSSFSSTAPFTVIVSICVFCFSVYPLETPRKALPWEAEGDVFMKVRALLGDCSSHTDEWKCLLFD